jgi:retron-type reverse transcriptase
MKRVGNLYPAICSFDNLWRAAYAAQRGKRFRPDVLAFHYDLEGQLFRLRAELQEKRYEPGRYRTFRIHDPKPRLISAAPYRDRIVHHALCQVIEPVFERTFIDDSYANRLRKGTHKALDRCTAFARRYYYVLKCDIEKYFPSIDHQILMERIARRIKCPDTMWLIARIVENSNPQDEIVRYFPGDTLFTPHERRRGIPIGNLTSQFLANVYLNSLDHFIAEELRPAGYLRFADDFLAFSDEKAALHAMLPEIQAHLNGLRLKLQPRKCQVMPVRCGVPFLGWQVFPDYRRLRRTTGVRFQRRLQELREEYAEGRIDLDRVKQSVMSWIGHLKHGDTRGLRRKLLAGVAFSRQNALAQGASR